MPVQNKFWPFQLITEQLCYGGYETTPMYTFRYSIFKIFLIAMGAEYLSYVKSIATFALKFLCLLVWS